MRKKKQSRRNFHKKKQRSRKRKQRSRKKKQKGGSCNSLTLPKGGMWDFNVNNGLSGGYYYGYNSQPALDYPEMSLNYSAAELNQTGGGLDTFLPNNLVEVGNNIGDVFTNLYNSFNANPSSVSHRAHEQHKFSCGTHQEKVH